MGKFTALATTIALGIIGLVIAVEFFAGLYPTAITTLGTLNNSGKVFNASGYWTNRNYTVIPLRSLVSAEDGIIPLVLVAVFIIGVIVITFAMIKGKGKR